jgi:hypothetical protein
MISQFLELRRVLSVVDLTELDKVRTILRSYP